jgi:hypothetical protein
MDTYIAEWWINTPSFIGPEDSVPNYIQCTYDDPPYITLSFSSVGGKKSGGEKEKDEFRIH